MADSMKVRMRLMLSVVLVLPFVAESFHLISSDNANVRTNSSGGSNESDVDNFTSDESVIEITTLSGVASEEGREFSLGDQSLNELSKVKVKPQPWPVIRKEVVKHECNRQCVKGAAPMTCRYHFKVEWYHTMSKACYECPFNMTHCHLDHCVFADGVKRPVVVVNRQIPGPAVEVCQGDKIEVEIENLLLEEGTSVHWHGHHQRGTPFMDGVPYVTQCPISPKSRFLYRYVADTPGTHFWHSHSAMQRGDGMFGSLIVRVPLEDDPHAEFFDFDLSEHVIVVTDWSHSVGVAKFLAHHHSNGDNKPTNLLVNGKGRYQEFEDEFGNVLYTPVETFQVEQGMRYRFRIVNAGFLNCPIEMSFDNHTIVVVSSDGSDIEPIETESLVTYAGERFDVIVQMNQDIDNYWIRFKGLMDCDERFTSAHQVAILRYKGATAENPTGEISYEAAERLGLQVNALNVGSDTEGSISVPEFRSLSTKKDPSLQLEADHKFFISYDFYGKNNAHFHASNLYGFDQITDRAQKLFTPQLNHISMKLPPFPLLTDLAETNKLEFCNSSTLNKNCEVEYCECTHVLQVPLGDVVELILVDKGFTYNANHPFHLHGYAFRVVGMERLGENVTIEEVQRLDELGLLRRNLQGAAVKDTVTVPDGGYTILRWHATNPGYWLFHCHIEYHVELGMAIVFKVGEDKDFPRAPKNFPRCHNYLPEEESTSETPYFIYKNYNLSDINEIEFEDINHVKRWTGSAVSFTPSNNLIGCILVFSILSNS